MKKLFTYLFFIIFSFQTPSLADDISDFQIEGMSVGDSALDYFSEEEFLQFKDKKSFKDKKYTARELRKSKFLKVYEGLQINYLTKDKKYIIQGLSGIIGYNNNIENCHIQKDIIKDELKDLFPNAKLTKNKKKLHVGGHWEGYGFTLVSGDLAIVACYDVPEKHTTEDHLRISIRMKKYNYWLTNAYK